jgi:hypothetical protein
VQYDPPFTAEDYLERLSPIRFGDGFLLNGEELDFYMPWYWDEENGIFWTEWFPLPIDYNPEWVSIDARGESVIITGELEHVCEAVPLPGAVWLLGSGLLGLLGLRKRR